MRELDHLKTLRQSAVSTRTINDFLAANGPKPMSVYDATGKTKLYDTVVDWQTLSVAKGMAYGLYLEMKAEGAELIAKQVLLEEGVYQCISPKQRARLDYYDTLI